MTATHSIGAGLFQPRRERPASPPISAVLASPVHALQDRIATAQKHYSDAESVWTPLARTAFTLVCSGMLWGGIGFAIRSVI